LFRTDDTIVSISTAAGASARGIVRLSGPQAIPLAEGVFRPARGALSDLGGFAWADGWVSLPDPPTDLPARAYVFRAPKSYTREDVVELHLPGCPPALGELVEALAAGGARRAEPGEFTARAFLSGRIDLSQAEAVADVVAADDDARLRAAMSALGGRLRPLCSKAADTAAEALATVEASVDLADEDIRFDDPAALAQRLRGLADELGDLARRAADMPETADRPRAVLAGRPNVGKSSLLNALSGEDRAIVSAMANTTRDVLSAPVTIRGACILLQDAAGFAPAGDALATAARSAARDAVARADALLFVLDASGLDPADAVLMDDVRQTNAGAPLLVLLNKVDLLDASRAQHVATDATRLLKGAAGALLVSALRGDGLEEVRRRLAELLDLSAARSGSALALHQRQRRALVAASTALGRAADLLDGAEEIADVAELAAAELRGGLAELGTLSGQIVTEDILGRIFARFCVGK